MFDEMQLLEEIDYLSLISPKKSAPALETLHSAISEPIVKLFKSSLTCGVHRMRIMRELYNFAALHVTSVVVINGKVDSVIYDDELSGVLAPFNSAEEKKPFSALLLGLQNGSETCIQGEDNFYPWLGDVFMAALYGLACSKKEDIEKIFTISLIEEPALLRLIDRGLACSVLSPIPLKNGIYTLPLRKGSFLPKVAMPPMPEKISMARLLMDSRKMYEVVEFENSLSL